MDVIKSEEEFNWDDIVVGDNRLDHSENFFAEKHITHEKFEVMEHLRQEFAANYIKYEKCKETDLLIREFAEKVSLNALEKHDEAVNQVLKDEKENICDNIKKHESNALDKTLTQPKKINLATSWSGRVKIVKNHVYSSRAHTNKNLSTPEAYKIHLVYKKKHEEAKRRQLDTESKKQEFHSRPMPNFSKCPEQTIKKKPAPKVTLPITPRLLKNYYKAQEVRKRKNLETEKSKVQPAIKFSSNTANVLREKPFVPQKKATRIDQKPFTLHVEKRLQQRKQFNEAMAEKRKQIYSEDMATLVNNCCWMKEKM